MQSSVLRLKTNVHILLTPLSSIRRSGMIFSPLILFFSIFGKEFNNHTCQNTRKAFNKFSFLSSKSFDPWFSKHRPSGPMLSISRFVRPSVRLSVCLCVCSLLRYRLTVFLHQLPEVGCPIFLEIRNPWGKVMERSGLRYEHFCLKIV